MPLSRNGKFGLGDNTVPYVLGEKLSMKKQRYVLQIRQDGGWVTESEHSTLKAAHEAWPTDYLGHINEYRIREKYRKPNKKCPDCRGTGKIKVYCTRDPDPAICPCKCLDD
jgi:hypothetical protein